MPKSKKREMVHVYLTPEEKAKTENEAKKLGISVSSFIKVKLFSKNLAVILAFIILSLAISENVTAAEVDLLGLTLDVKESGLEVDNVNIISSTDFVKNTAKTKVSKYG